MFINIECKKRSWDMEFEEVINLRYYDQSTILC